MTPSYVFVPGGMPQVNSPLPNMVTTAQVTGPAVQPGLMPTDLLNPMPSITNTAPVVIGSCDPITSWINDNPLLAIGALLGLAFFTFRTKKGR